MFPYWLLFSLFAAGAVQYPTDPRRQIQGGPILVALAAATLVMIGLRYGVGGDWVTYIEILKTIGSRDFWEGIWLQEPGYGVLNWFVFRAGLDIWAVNLVCAAIFVWGLAKFARRQPNPWLVFLVAVPYLIIVVAMGYTRQAVAIGFILAGLTVLDRGLMRFMGYMLCAVAFHKSAVVVLPFVALSISHRRVITGAIALGSAILLYYVFVQASLDRLVTVYVDQAYASQGAGVRVAMNLPPAVLFLAFRHRFTAVEQEAKLWRNFALAAIAALVLLYFTTATTAVDRLALYIIPLQMFVLGRLPSVFHDKGRPSIALTLLVILYSAAIQFVWLNYADNRQAWVPYRIYFLSED